MKNNLLSFFNGQTTKAVALSTALLISGGAFAADNLIPRIPVNPAKYQVLDGVEYTSITVKFKELTGIRLGSSGLFSKISNPEMPASLNLDWTGFDSELINLQSLVASQGLNLTKSSPFSDEKLAELKKKAEERSGKELADMGLYFKLPIPKGFSTEQIKALVDSLNSFTTVEAAFAKPPAVPAAITPDFQDYNPANTYYQGYLDAPTPGDNDAYDGINAKYAWNFSGGRGEGVNIIDVEGGWTTSHEDFPVLAFSYDTSENSSGWIDHGTAVVGVIAAQDNGFGVTGIANQANIGLSNIYGDSYVDGNGDTRTGTDAAILRAADMAGEGGVILIEVHRKGPTLQETCACNNGQCNYIAVEYWSDDYEAIEIATALGVTVVEAAGNGSANFDDPIYGGAFDRNQKDSGAIIVGASRSKNSDPMCWTNYGSRIDVRGWGEMVATLGYGEMYKNSADSSNQDYWYTGTFSGTSSAAPIVTGAAAVLQGISENVYGTTLSPMQIRDILSTNGTEQDIDLEKNIGLLPDLMKAIATINSSHGFVCNDFTSTVADHETAGRAYSETVTEGETCWGTFCYGGTQVTTWYTAGSNIELGTDNSITNTLHEGVQGEFAIGNCPSIGNIEPTNSAPVLILNGNDPMTIYVGETFVDPGATASDSEDGDLTSEIVTTGYVDSNTIDTYTLTYTATDSGGLSDTKTRTVNVIAIPTCQEFTDTVSNHETAGRAYSVTETTGQTCWGTFCYGGTTTTTWYAEGSDENLGTNGNATVTLRTNEGGYITGNCPSDPVAPVLVSYQVASNTNVQAVITGTASDADGDIDRVVLGLGAVTGIVCEGTTSFTCTLDWDANGFDTGAEISLSVSAWDSRNEVSNIEHFTLTRPEQQPGSAPVISNLDYTVDGQNMVVTADVTDIDGDLYAIRLMYADQPGELHCDNSGGYQYTCNLTNHDVGAFNFKVHAIDSEGNAAETAPFTVEFVEKVETTCFTTVNSDHVSAGRAELKYNVLIYAIGSGDYLGMSSDTTSLEETSAGIWTKVTSCD
ncbi:MAG: DUF5011 domain-containing protein [Gammaproteobacteria bacterium]|nr:MAG: DUF5011 domain-containing protein [Gammaproteobacteria bacterium]